MSLKPETAAILCRPFTAEECSTRPGAGGRTLTYVDQLHVIQRLNEAFGIGGWSWTAASSIDHDKVLVQGHLSIDNGPQHFGCSIEPLKNDAEKAVKTADTDALKRAARLFGVGLHLYDKTDPVHRGSNHNRGKSQPTTKWNNAYPPPSTAKQHQLIGRLWPKVFDFEEHYRAWLETTHGVTSATKLNIKQASSVIDALQNGQIETGRTPTN